MSQKDLDFDPPVERPFPFDGASYIPHLDQDRLDTQLGRIVAFMTERPGAFYTVAEIRREMERRYPDAGWPENSIQAQLRNAKKVNYRHERRRCGDPARGLFEFALWPPEAA